MNRHQCQELFPVIQAFAQGKDVQKWCVNYDPSAPEKGAWFTDPNPDFNVNIKWRVAPTPREWVVIVEDGVVIDQFDERMPQPGERVLVREVIQ